MRRLYEWKDAQGNKVSPNASSPTPVSKTASSGASFKKSFKTRLRKLINHYGQHLPAEVDYIIVNLLADNKLVFTETHDDGTKVEYRISIDPTPEVWNIRIFVDEQLHNDLQGTGWTKLLKTLKPYIEIPDMGTSEYKDLLVEWVDTNGKKITFGNSSSTSQPAAKTSYKTNKEKFTALTRYMQNHKDSFTTNPKVIQLDDKGFIYKEHRKPSGEEYTIAVDVVYSSVSSAWRLEVYKNSILLDSFSGTGWEKFLYYLSVYFNVPSPGGAEYKSLTEGLLEWHLMNPPTNNSSKPTTFGPKNYPSQEERYKKNTCSDRRR